MAMTAPIRVFPKQIRARKTSQMFWGEAETQLDKLIEEMDRNPIPSTPVTRAGASIVSQTVKESQSAK